ncbi:nuclear factor Y, subunit A1, nuclear factor Y subunit A1, EMBRYO DEFECTIVE 2220 [Hibiscus trionum]|uniref:Nuclear transcription factor Y subunit n=1 Tax=Hibiscus trionum TaxID=183268 RepID=A0A9W7HQ83_HIBTR|nr:nuclear factor Y, subunit A1, nuclear factor Y subunit A1, EMBRYO DEFECTIVE 2220 [Hibiscus trionum]
MQSKSEGGRRLEPDLHGVTPTAVYSEPWWRNNGYGAISPRVRGGNVSKSSSGECPNGSESNDDQTLSNDGVNKEDDVNKERQAAASSRSVGSGGQEHLNLQQHVVSTMPAMHDECLTQPPQLELVSHSIACASNPYQDPFYGGMVAAYGHQPLGYPPFVGMPHARMALPFEKAQEPVYVNAKQYQGILRRRQARAKAELEKKDIKVRKPYLHESRHQHAMRRARGSGGRFAKKTDANSSKQMAEGRGTGSGLALSSQSTSSSGSGPFPADYAETWNPTLSQKEARGSLMHETHHINGSGHYQKRGCTLSSNQASHRPLAIQ